MKEKMGALFDALWQEYLNAYVLEIFIRSVGKHSSQFCYKSVIYFYI